MLRIGRKIPYARPARVLSPLPTGRAGWYERSGDDPGIPRRDLSFLRHFAVTSRHHEALISKAVLERSAESLDGFRWQFRWQLLAPPLRQPPSSRISTLELPCLTCLEDLAS